MESELDSVLGYSYPVFNHDQNYFTPSFVVDADKLKVQRQLNFYRNYHTQRVEDAHEEKS